MFAKTKIVFAAALVSGAIASATSGALAFDNIGEIRSSDQRSVSVQDVRTHAAARGHDAYAAAPRRRPAQVNADKEWIDRPTDYISSY